MGRFTDDMGRLRQDIESQRDARHSMIANNRQEVAEAAQAFMSDLRDRVENLQTGFRQAHAEMAADLRAGHQAYLQRLGTAVADLQRETTDLVGHLAGERNAARQAWHQSPPRARKAPGKDTKTASRRGRP